MPLSKRKKTKCIKCGVNLNGENTTWYRQKNYIHKCNDCIKVEKRNWSREAGKRNPGITAERSRRHNEKLKKENPVKYTARQICGSARKRSRALGVNYDIDAKYVQSISPSKCPIFGKILKYGGGKKTKYSASIDRIDPKLGYIRGNVMIISLLGNTMKNEADKTELHQFAKWCLRDSQ